MNDIVLSRTLLKNPSRCIGVLLLAVLTFESFNWIFAFHSKLVKVAEMGGFFHYTVAVLTSIIIPELVTLFILLLLIDFGHELLQLKRVKLMPRNVLFYEFKLLPVLLVAFFLFNPLTQSVRFVMEQLPIYIFRLEPLPKQPLQKYVYEYLLGTFTLRNYMFYLIPVLIMGYGTVNSSLVIDILEQRRQNRRRSTPLEPVQPVASEPGRTALTHIRGKNNHGEMLLPVQECYWFETEERSYFAIHPNGRYAVTKTMNELEAELNPDQFFRVRRDCIINLAFVGTYAHWEKGKYIIRMQTPNNDEIDMPKARLQEFRNRLGYHQGPVQETSAS